MDNVNDFYETLSQSSFSQNSIDSIISNNTIEDSSLDTSGEFGSSSPKGRQKIKKRKCEFIDTFANNLSYQCCNEKCTWRTNVEGLIYLFISLT